MAKRPCSHTGCRAQAHHDTPWCTFHDPKFAERIAAARHRGGKHAGKGIGIEVTPPKTVQEIAEFLGVVQAAVARGRCSDAKALALTRLASLQLRALGVKSLDMLRDIESKLGVDYASGKTEETEP